MQRLFVGILFTLLPLLTLAQTRWQQHVNYIMDVSLDVETHRVAGTQRLTYTNHSPDTLHRVFYHLYFNAFQPYSMMDERNHHLPDPDGRVGKRIRGLDSTEIGFQRIHSLTQNGAALSYEVAGTILEVELVEAIKPGEEVLFEMTFTSQVPKQIRRSGRDNKEGIDYSMTQWYPKMCAYDLEGWHADPYIGREFYGEWGDFDVTITIDSAYVIGGTGYLQNPQEIGHGYEREGQEVTRPSDGKLRWHFLAPNVHDFAWAADPDYVHEQVPVPDGPMLHFIYQADSVRDNWKKLQGYTVRLFELVNKHYGKYPYDQFTVIQGGDGGMEYPMSTLVTGRRSMGSLLGTTVHEVMHAWYYGVLGFNEANYPWMDEGFASYVEDLMVDSLLEKGAKNPHQGAYARYYRIIEKGWEEPSNTHGDHYTRNYAYSVGTYSKGTVFLRQLGYIIGDEALQTSLRRFFQEWAFRHPEPRDFKRVAEKVSGLELDWYFDYFINTTKVIDYGIKEVKAKRKAITITLENTGTMPMPVDLELTFKDGSKEILHIPLRIMRGAKPQEHEINGFTVLPDWNWVNPIYTLTIFRPGKKLKTVTLDASERLADVNPDNNHVDVAK